MLHLTPEDIETFHGQGYIVKKSCFSEEIMRDLADCTQVTLQRIIVELDSLPRVVSDEEQSHFIDGSRVVYRYNAEDVSIARINGVGGIASSLMQPLVSDAMVRTFMALLGCTDLEHIICQLHPKLPGDGIAYPRHRDVQFRKAFDPDWTDILGNGSYAICILPIDPMSEENGGLWVDKNSLLGEDAPEDILWIETTPGDILFMNPYVWHGSGPNKSLQARRTLLSGFCAFGANHKAYPGAFVNMRFTLTGEGEVINVDPAPWQQPSSESACSVGVDADANH